MAHNRRWWQKARGWATAVLLIMYTLALTSMTQKSPTFDEQGFITRGLGYLRGDNRHMRVGHPLGLNALNAALLVNDPTVHLPLDTPAWQETNFHRPSEQFLWEIGNDVKHVMFLARLPSIWLGMLLAAITGYWAWRLTHHHGAGLLALTLIAFDPNILANMRLATTDLGLALGVTTAGFTLWAFLKRPTWQAAILAGIGFGLLQNTKFTAGLFVPLFTLVIFIGLFTQWRTNFQSLPAHTTTSSHISLRHAFPWRTLFMLIIAFPLTAFLTLWAAYGFQIGTLPEALPTLPQLGGVTLPLSHHIEQLLDIGGRLQVKTPAFLMGTYSSTGWWYYFPTAFILKTPLPMLILLAAAITLRIASYLKYSRTQAKIHESFFTDAALLIPAFGYLAIALTSEVNLGYRHLLPLLPFLALFTANSLAPYLPIANRQSPIANRLPHYTILGLAAALFLIALWIHPHYLSYFNLLAGGPHNGWHYLVDSNIDWGQDLESLKIWMAENDVETVWLSYFGEARPEYYGINYTGLDSWPPRLWNPQTRPYTPHNPAPGIYAISVTNLQGVHFANHDQFAWFRSQKPVAKVGYSIFIYEVRPYGDPIDLLLGGMQLDELTPEDIFRFQTNQIKPHWVDPSQSLIFTPNPLTWAAVHHEANLHPLIESFLVASNTQAVDNAYTLYQLNPAVAFSQIEDNQPPVTFLSANGQEIAFIGIVSKPQIETNTAAVLEFSTVWLNQSEPTSVKIFVHLLDENGRILSQWDGLGSAWAGWWPQNTLWQIHTLALPPEAANGRYTLIAGLYNPETGERWLTQTGKDHLILEVVEIGE